ncbi:HNH endonuclease domain-containing protein [Acidobacteriota bacterium]
MKLPESETLSIPAFEQMLCLKSMTNSYKLYWFAAVFDEIRKENVEMSFKKIVLTMIAKCWHSIVAYKLNLGFMDKLGDLVSYILRRYKLKKNMSPRDLFSFLENLLDTEFETRVVDFYRYIPYRMISPFYKNLRSLKDHEKNKKIEELSRLNNDAIYRIHSGERKIVVNRNWFDYIYKNQIIINGWYSYKLVYFLQQRNPSIPAIPFKIEAPQKRNMKNARTFWSEIIKIKTIKDIYTNHPLSVQDFNIDHYIPWSFVLHDQLWNLAPTSKAINSRKNDMLPRQELYMDKFCHLQYDALKTALSNQFPEELLGDYIEISKDIFLSRNIKSDIFVKNLKESLIPLYQLAYNQGFQVWDNLQ